MVICLIKNLTTKVLNQIFNQLGMHLEQKHIGHLHKV